MSLNLMIWIAVVGLFAQVLTLQGRVLDGYPTEAEITGLPGLEASMPSRMFSGYVAVPHSQKRLFYVLVLSEGNPVSDPLVLWTNGGPGCSSMGAFFEENGPFRTTSEGLGADPALLLKSVQLSVNAHSWSKVANVLYFDTPAGTGLSYSTDKADYVTNDTQAASDLHHGLKAWYNIYSPLQSNRLYLSGESYAGVYIPLLAEAILKSNRKDSHPFINLKGYFLGNPTTDNTKNYMLAELYQGMSLISEDLLHSLHRSSCPAHGRSKDGGDGCDALQQEVKDRTDDIFIFNVLIDCFYAMSTYNTLTFEMMKAKLRKEGITYTDPLYGGHEDSCDYDDRETGYLMNDADFREAMHGAPFADKEGTLAGFFEMCQGRINYTKIEKDMVPIHRANIKTGLEVMIYSGDHDRVLPTVGTEKWTSKLGKDLGGRLTDFAPWWRRAPESFGYQIGGYMSIWDSGLSFATIRGAGHQVPTHKPAQILDLVRGFLAGDLLSLTVKPLSLSTLLPDEIDKQPSIS